VNGQETWPVQKRMVMGIEASRGLMAFINCEITQGGQRDQLNRGDKITKKIGPTRGEGGDIAPFHSAGSRSEGFDIEGITTERPA